MRFRRVIAMAVACLVAMAGIAPVEAGCASRACMAALVSGGQHFTYRVDSVRGTSAGPVFQNITSLPTIKSGDSIGLACGSYWRQQLSINANNVTVAGYGQCSSALIGASGNLPILDASDVILNANLTDDGSGAYSTATITFIDSASPSKVNVLETGGPGDPATGQFLKYVTSQALCDSTAGSYFIPSMTEVFMPATGKIYIHPTDSSNAISNGYLYEFSNRAGGIVATAGSSNLKISNVEGRKSADNGGSIQVGDNATITNVIARNGGKHNMIAGGGVVISHSLLVDAYYSIPNLLVLYDNAGTGLNLTVTGNIFQQSVLLAGMTSGQAVFSHTSGGSHGSALLNGNWYISLNNAIMTGAQFANVTSVVASNENMSKLSNGYTLQQNWTVNNWNYVSALNNNQQPLYSPTGFSGLVLSINNSNVCAANTNHGLIDLRSPATALTITGGKLYVNTPQANSAFEAVSNTATGIGSTFTFNGVDFGGAVNFWKPIQDGASGDTFLGDHNIYESLLFAPQFILNNAAAKTTLPAWQALVSPADANSTESGGSAVSACTLPTIPSVN